MEQRGNSFPKKGHLIIWDGFSFEIVRVKNYEIKEVKIKSVNGEYLRSTDAVYESEKPEANGQKAVSVK
jgi:hypothetical protein